MTDAAIEPAPSAASSSARSSEADAYAFTAERLSVRYAGVTVLDEVSFRVEPGAIVGVLGRNGAGKTTLLNCLLGLIVPDEGHATVGQVRSEALTDAVRQRVGYVSQMPDVFEALTVLENIELIGQFYAGWSPAYALQLCTRLDLAPAVRAGTLSPGAKQRLAIAQALAHQPDLLVLDEPVSSLDPLARRDFMRILFDHAERIGRPVTTLLSSHLLEDIERVATHLLFVGRRRVQLFASHDEIAEHVRVVFSSQSPDLSRYGVAGLVYTTQQRDGRWRSVVDTRTFDVGQLKFHVDIAAPTLGDLFEATNA